MPTPLRSLWNGGQYNHDRVRIAYLSADFHRHAIAFLLAELFELHDRSRFEVLGVSYGPDDDSDMRARLVAAFDQFHDVQSMSDRDVAKLLNDLEVDIAIDLNGLTRDCRPCILAHRPAPIQVNYLGYPGTMGADFIDYVIADKVVLPLDRAAVLDRKDRASARLLSGKRFEAEDCSPYADATRTQGCRIRASCFVVSTIPGRSRLPCSTYGCAS